MRKITLTGILLVLGISLALPVWAEDAGREEDMFGMDQAAESPAVPEQAEAVTPPVAAAGAAGRDEDLFGAESGAEATGRADTAEADAAAAARAEEAENKLAIGGQFYQQINYAWIENPLASLARPSQRSHTLGAPGLLDLYLDAQINPRLRFFTRGRLTHDITVADGTTVSGRLGSFVQRSTALALNELWLKLYVPNLLFLTVGQQPLKWGAGRLWNPTDFINTQMRDALDFFDQRSGVRVIKAHAPIPSLDWNLYALANLEGASQVDQVGGALRGEFVAGPAELALSAAGRRDNHWQLGADLSAGLWLFDVRAEAAFEYGSQVTRYTGTLQVPTASDPGLSVPMGVDQSKEWLAQVCAGADIEIQYNDQDTITVGAEYFYNQAGYDDSSLYPWLILNQAFTPRRLGRHYAGFYALAPSPGSWNNTTLNLFGMANLSDLSGLLRLNWSQRVLTHLTVNAWAAGYLGNPGEFRMSLQMDPIPAGQWARVAAVDPRLLAFAPGVDTAAPVLDAGLALTVNF